MVDDALWDEFHALVNMGPDELRDWLTSAAGEPGALPPDLAGVERSRRIAEILGKERGEITDDDVAVMRSVVDSIHELRGTDHEASRADEAVRHRLMCLGHDPLRAAAADATDS